MTPTALAKAVAEAKRFLEIAKAVPKPEGGWFYPSKETAAAKRASMDLTRALAEMRKR